MGWCNGSYIACEIYDNIRGYLPEIKRKEVAKFIYDVFCEGDADCWEDDMSIVIDADECGDEEDD